MGFAGRQRRATDCAVVSDRLDLAGLGHAIEELVEFMTLAPGQSCSDPEFREGLRLELCWRLLSRWSNGGSSGLPC